MSGDSMLFIWTHLGNFSSALKPKHAEKDIVFAAEQNHFNLQAYF